MGLGIETEAVSIKTRKDIESFARVSSSALNVAWQNSCVDQTDIAGDRTFQRSRLTHVVNTAISRQNRNEVKASLQHMEGIVEYMWFGDEDTPLPHGLTRYMLPGELTPILSLDYSTPVGIHYMALGQLLEDAGIDQLLAYRHTVFAEQSADMLRPLAKAVIANTPGFRLLESFLIEQKKDTERPLTPTERMIEESKATEAVRNKHGLANSDEFRFHTQAKRDLTRRKFHIDEERLPETDRNLEKRSPIARARKFFFDLAAREVSIAFAGVQLRSLETVDNKIKVTTDEELSITSGDSFLEFGYSHGFLDRDGLMYMRNVSASLVNDAVLQLFIPEGESQNYKDILDTLLQHYTDILIDNLSFFTRHNYAKTHRTADILTLLNNPTVADEELDSLIYISEQKDLIPTLRVLSRKEYRDKSKETLGYVRKRSGHERGARIFTYVKADQELPPASKSEADLMLELLPDADGLIPSVLGYQITGHTPETNLFSFQYDAEADPYTPCKVRIPTESKIKLAEEYANIGLNELAALVGQNTDLTVSQLAAYIAETNNYYLERKGKVDFTPSALYGYKNQVGGGRLSMQCRGFSNFLKLSLDSAFGPGYAGFVGGHTISKGNNRISGLGHQQTTFIDPETQEYYIVDATPTSPSLRDLFRSESREHYELSRPILPSTAPKVVEIAKVVFDRKRTIVDQEQVKSNLLKYNKNNLVMRLRMIYGSHGQPLDEHALFETISRLRTDDIVFRTLSTVVLSATQESSSQDASRTLRYLQAIRACDDERILRQVDPNEYNSQYNLLNALEESLNQIIRVAN